MILRRICYDFFSEGFTSSEPLTDSSIRPVWTILLYQCAKLQTSHSVYRKIVTLYIYILNHISQFKY